jgi:hypothetical protein
VSLRPRRCEELRDGRRGQFDDSELSLGIKMNALMNVPARAMRSAFVSRLVGIGERLGWPLVEQFCRVATTALARSRLPWRAS